MKTVEQINDEILRLKQMNDRYALEKNTEGIRLTRLSIDTLNWVLGK